MSNSNSFLLELTSKIVKVYVEHNLVSATEVSELIKEVFNTLQQSDSTTQETSTTSVKLPIPIEKSVTDNYIICLEDGKKLKSLKHHLRTIYNLTPEQYRQKWNLPSDYPMDAPCLEHEQMEIFNALLHRRSNLYRRLAAQ